MVAMRRGDGDGIYVKRRRGRVERQRTSSDVKAAARLRGIGGGDVHSVNVVMVVLC